MSCYILVYVILTGILAYVILCQKTKIKAASPIISRQIDGETMATVTDFILLDSKITADGDCSREIKRYFLFVG